MNRQLVCLVSILAAGVLGYSAAASLGWMPSPSWAWDGDREPLAGGVAAGASNASRPDESEIPTSRESLSSARESSWPIGKALEGPETQASPKDEEADIQSALATLETCTSQWPNPDPGDAVSGLWANPKRYGTGWTFAYKWVGEYPNRERHMMAVWHTFYPKIGGAQTWLITDWKRVNATTLGERTWNARLWRTKRVTPNDLNPVVTRSDVGSVSIVFPGDSATRAAITWHWNDDNGVADAVSATECIYAFGLDQPGVTAVVGPSLQAQAPDPEPTGTPPHGNFYTGIWYDASSPGFEWEVAGIPSQTEAGNTELNTLSIYDTDGVPVWVWAQIGPQDDWPSPYWIRTGADRTEVEVGYRTARFNMATTDCTDKTTCIFEEMFVPQAHYFGRQFHDVGTAVVGLKIQKTSTTNSPVEISWPPSDWAFAPSESDVRGCPDGHENQACRPVAKQTDTEFVATDRHACDITTPNGTCDVKVTWVASPLGTVTRIDPTTGLLISHSGDLGIVGGGSWGERVDTLSADERVLYKLEIGTRTINTVGVHAGYSQISASQPCVVPAGSTECTVTVTWSTPEPGPEEQITVRRFAKLAGGAVVQQNSIDVARVGSFPVTLLRDPQIEHYYFELRREETWLSSTSSNPTIPVSAYVTAAPTVCSIPIGQNSCPITVNWLTGSPSAQLWRVYLPPSVPGEQSLTTGANGTFSDSLPRDSHAQYVVKIGGVEQARSADVSAITSRIWIHDDVTSCVIPAGQSTCSVIVQWTSAPTAQVFRVEEISGGNVTQIGESYTGLVDNDPLSAGVPVHYEVRIAGLVHAVSPTVIARTDDEGGDSDDGLPEQPGLPAAFSEPSLDTDSDRVGATTGEFRVDAGGNATYRIPLAVAPGAGGFAPKLALTYASGGGDGILGTGFSLEGLSAITPCRPTVETGDPVVTANPTEFCLDGQRLLLVAGTHREIGAEYRTEIESFQRVRLTAIDLSFIDGAKRHAFVFSVEGKDGSLRMFGGGSGTVFGRVNASLEGVQAQAWLQTRLEDAAGNPIDYQYTSSSALGERHLNHVSYIGGDVYFDYVGSPRADVAYSVLGAHRQTMLLEGIRVLNSSGISLRYYEPTYNALSSWTGMRPHLMGLKECASEGGTCYPATSFTWSEPTTQAQELSGGMTPGIGYYRFGDLNGDKRGDLWWTSDAGSDNNRLHVSVFTGDTQGTPAMRDVFTDTQLLPDGFVNGGLWETFDYNGDGRDDLLFAWPNRDNAGGVPPNRVTWFLRLSTGSGLGPEQALFYVDVDIQRSEELALLSAAGGGPGGPQPNGTVEYLGSSMLMDVDGDGLADLVFRATDGKAWVAHTKRTGDANAPYEFDPTEVTFLNESGGAVGDGRCGFGTAVLKRKEENHSQATDFDGDGRADLRFLVDATNCPVWEGQGYRIDAFSSKGVGANGKFVFQNISPFEPNGFLLPEAGIDHIDEAGQRLRTQDVNADGLTDLVYLSNNVWRFRLGGPDSSSTDACVASCQLHGEEQKVQLLDFDGDGKLDFWMPRGNDYEVYLWGGINWVPVPATSQGVLTQYKSEDDGRMRIVADFDGDGGVDFLHVKRSDGKWSMRRSLNHHRPRGMLTQIVNGFGAKTTIDYASLTYSNVYRRDYDAPFVVSGRGSPVFDITSPMYVVSSVRSSAPIPFQPNAESAVSYRYAGLKVQGGGRGSLGFRRVSTLDSQNLMEVDSYYAQRFPYSGLPEYSETRRLSANWSSSCSNADSSTCMVYVPLCSGRPDRTCNDDLPELGNRSRTIKESVDQWQWRGDGSTGALAPTCDQAGSLPGLGFEASRQPQPFCSGAMASEGELDRRSFAGGQTPIFIARIESLTNNYDPVDGVPGGVLSSESVEFPLDDYDEYGNPGSSVLRKTSADATPADPGPDLTITSLFAYENDESSWHLGRLLTSTVQTRRQTGSDVRDGVRQSSFTYNSAGLLDSETVAAMKGTFPDGLFVEASVPSVVNYYTHDAFGNRTKTSICSSEIAEVDCRLLAASGAGGYQFHPANAAVMRYSRSVYDSSGRFVDQTIEAFGQGAGSSREVVTAHVAARNAGGDPEEILDAHQNQTKIRYGVLGRERFRWNQTGATTRWDARYCSGLPFATGMATAPCPASMGLVYQAIITQSGAPTSRVFYDMLGRPTLTLKEDFVIGQWNATIAQYDAHGNVKRQSDPFRVVDSGANAAEPVPGVSIYWTQTSYDELDRPEWVIRTGDGAQTTFDYDGPITKTTLPHNISGLAQSTTEIRNGLGEVVRTRGANGFETEMKYDAFGNVRSVVRGGQTTTMAYDGLGRRTNLTDPDLGTRTYQVNGAGEVIKGTSGRGTCIVSERDGRGRVWRRRDYTNTACTSLESESLWTYDTAGYGIGSVAQETNAQVTRTFNYDELGRPQDRTTFQEGKAYTDEWTYDEFGRSFQHFFQAGTLPKTGERTVYTAHGYPKETRSAYPLPDGTFPVYQEIRTMNARGQVTQERGAAGAEYIQDREYAPATGRLKRLLAQSTQAGLLQDWQYDYDLVGNVTRRTGTDNLRVVKEEFAYDELQRLTDSEVWMGGQMTYVRSQDYDAQGNMTYKSDVGSYGYGTRPSACSPSSVVHPHAVSTAGTTYLCYDGNGNLVKQVDSGTSKTLDYTAADQVRDVQDSSGARVGFVYGPNRDRVKRLDYAGSSTAETVVHEVGTAQARYSANASNGASQFQEVRRVVGNVIVVQSGSGTNYRLKRLVLLTDAQGSTHQVLGAMTLAPVNGSSPSSFDAWGQRRNSADWGSEVPWTAGLEGMLRQSTAKGYTGHEMAESVGLIHMNGRIYDARLGRFVQADPMVQAPGDGQSWNRYSYGFNNPLVYTDPTGYMSWGEALRIVAAVVITVYTGGAAAMYFAASNYAAGFAIAAVGGFAAGAVQTGTLKGAVTGAVTAVAFAGVGAAFSQANAGWAYNGTNMNFSGYAAMTLTNGTVGGVMAELQGGKFGHGFASAGVSTAMAPTVGAIRSDAGRMMATAVVGGTASTLAGGKFANGAVTGAFASAFEGAMASRSKSYSGSAGNGKGSSTTAPMSDGIIGRMADDGRGPPAPYASIEDAAFGGLAVAEPLGRVYEYAGAVIPNTSGGFYATTPVTIFDRENFGFTLPKGIKPVAIYHTHPVGSTNPNYFSLNDVQQSKQAGVSSYIGIYDSSSIRVFNPATMSPITTRPFGGGQSYYGMARGDVVCERCFE